MMDRVSVSRGFDNFDVRFIGLIFAILARITVEGQHRCDPRGTGPTHRVDHDEQLHQVVIRRRRCGLHHIHIFTAHVLINLHKRLAIGERLDRTLAELDADVIANGVGERFVGGAAKKVLTCWNR